MKNAVASIVQTASRPSTRFAPLGILGVVGAAALGPACSAGSGATAPEKTASTKQTILGVPAAPTDPAARVGVYNWGGSPSGYSFSDMLVDPANLVAGLGARTIRVALSNPDAYWGTVSPTTCTSDGDCPGATDPGATSVCWISSGSTSGTCKEVYSSLSQVALSARYQTLFGSSSFDTYLLTTYSLADNPTNGCAPDWYSGLSGGDASAEESELAALASTLSAYYGGKTFILLNWEGDTAIGALAEYCDLPLTSTMWTGYSQWITARGQGVLDARGQGVSNVYSGLEFNAVQRTPGDAYYGNQCSPTDTTSLASGCAWCDGGSYPCVISEVAPGVSTIDYLSYSSWQSVGVNSSSDSDVAVRLEVDLARAQGLVYGASPANFIVGEFGADRNQWGEARAATRMSFAVSGLTAFGASYGIYWQALDNAGGGGFGVFKPDGTESLQGQAIATPYGVGCAFSAPTTIAYGGDWEVGVTSNLQGYGVYWFGTANGSWDANNVYSGTATNLYQDYGPYYDEGDTFTRYAVMEDGSGNAVCTTNVIQVTVE